MTNSIMIYEKFDQLQRAALALAKSGYFTDVKSEAQAIVKVMAGAELGLPPFASMTGIHIIQGKPVLGANVIATLVKNDPRYNYAVKTCTDQDCVITWIEDGKNVGESGFTMKEASAAGLSGKDNWKKYPSDMLFARAISRGARRFAPGIFGGSPVYTPDEMGVDVDEEGYVDTTAVEIVEPQPEPTPEPQAHPEPAADRPYAPEVLRERIGKYAAENTSKKATAQHRKVLASALDGVFNGDTEKRHSISKYLAGSSSTKDMSDGAVWAMLKWLDVGGFNQPPAKVSMDEARNVLASLK
jgi:hypothetical protein